MTSRVLAAVLFCQLISQNAIHAQVVHPPGEFEQRQMAVAMRPPDTAPAKLPDLDDDVNLRKVLRYASLNNSQVRAAFDDWLAAIEKVPQAGALENPRLGLGLDRNVGEGLFNWLQIGIEQAFPGKGKRVERARQALVNARAAGWRFQASQVELRRSVIEAYAELLRNRHRTELEEENIRLARVIHDVSLKNLSSGFGSQGEVLKNQVSITETESDVRALKIDERRLRSTLNKFLGRRADAPIGELSDVGIKFTKKPMKEFLNLACNRNPELSAMEAEIRSKESDIQLANLEHNPDFTIGTTIMAMEQMVQAGLSLPINSERIEAQVNEAIASHAAQQARYTNSIYETLARLVSAVADVEDADRVTTDYGNELIPKQRELLDVQLRGYRAGQGAFLDVFDTRRSLIQSQRLLVEAEAQRLKARAQIEAICGTVLMTLDTVPYSHSRFVTSEVASTSQTVESQQSAPMEDSHSTATMPAMRPPAGAEPVRKERNLPKTSPSDSGTTIGAATDKPSRTTST